MNIVKIKLKEWVFIDKNLTSVSWLNMVKNISRDIFVGQSAG